MSQFEDVRKQDLTYKCDNCGKTFKAVEVKLEKAKDNLKILTPGLGFRYVDKNGNIMGGSEQPSGEHGDQVFVSPCCNTTHLFGFDRV